MQQNSQCRLCGDRDEMINHIISECSKLAQKEYKVRHEWIGKVIHREMCRRFQFDHTNKWYMHNPAPVLENDSHKLLWEFDIHTDHLIPARRPDFIIINKKRESAKLYTLLSRFNSYYSIFCHNQNRLSFFFQVSFSSPWPDHLMENFPSLSPDRSMPLFFFPFFVLSIFWLLLCSLFQNYFCLYYCCWLLCQFFCALYIVHPLSFRNVAST